MLANSEGDMMLCIICLLSCKLAWHPWQGTDPDYMWAVTVMMYWLKLAAGLLCGCLSILWLVHVVLYVMLAPPLYLFLNTFFSKMDRVFPLFGTLAFAIFCFYLIGESLA